jgi:hypothetical protein
MNGSGYNGAKSATCPHFRAPDTVTTYTLDKLIAGEHGMPTTVRIVCCSNCNLELYPAEDV